MLDESLSIRFEKRPNPPCRGRRDESNDPPTIQTSAALGEKKSSDYIHAGFLPQIISLFYLHVEISGAERGMISDNMTQANCSTFLMMGLLGLGPGGGI